jgi:hypothetical protein
MRPQPCFLAFLLLTVLVLSNCKKDSDALLPDALFSKNWYNTRQQDASGAYVYQPEGTFEPMGWGIDGFRFEKDGRFVLYTQGPADELLAVAGTWTVEGDNTFNIQPDDSQYSAFSILVYSVQANSLKARRNL